MTQSFLLNNFKLVELRGDDVASFLQSQITNDINLLDSNKIIYALFLNPQGRFLYDCYISKKNDSYILEINADQLENFIKRVNFYKLRSDVSITTMDDYNVIYSREISENSLKDPRHKFLGYRIYTDNFSKFNFTENDIYSEDKYSLGIPEGFIDLIPEKTLVPEFHMDMLNAISYTKGCYTGQELISRTKNLGEVRKKPYILKLKENTNLDNYDVFDENMSKIGKITSTWKNFAIAILKIEKAESRDNAVLSDESKCDILKCDWC